MSPQRKKKEVKDEKEQDFPVSYLFIPHPSSLRPYLPLAFRGRCALS
jgi:hypothetical protein